VKLATVINVGYGAVALKHAVETQTLLLDRLGTKLDSIRLAAPKLLRQACASAIAENPDILVMVGGPRSIRRAGEIACERGVPILFLSPDTGVWTRHLSASLTLEGMVSAIARERFRPVRIDVGTVAGRIFFEEASCGLFPHLAELHRAFEEADTFDEGWRVMSRAVQLAHLLVNPNVYFEGDNLSSGYAARLTVTVLREPVTAIENLRETPDSSLTCSATRYDALGFLGGFLSRSNGATWRRPRVEHFKFTKLRVNAGNPSWILLDGEPVRFEGAVQFGFAPTTLQTFAFNAAAPTVNDSNRNDFLRSASLNKGEAAQLCSFFSRSLV
jgi:diacylglycerol kinase family enzyme